MIHNYFIAVVYFVPCFGFGSRLSAGELNASTEKTIFRVFEKISFLKLKKKDAKFKKKNDPRDMRFLASRGTNWRPSPETPRTITAHYRKRILRVSFFRHIQQRTFLSRLISFWPSFRWTRITSLSRLHLLRHFYVQYL